MAAIEKVRAVIMERTREGLVKGFRWTKRQADAGVAAWGTFALIWNDVEVDAVDQARSLVSCL